MTAVDPIVRAVPASVPDDPAIDRLGRICPYLAAADGTWRSASVTREHRCGAVSPPAQLAAEKQRRLCLTAAHPSCATFEAARAARPLGPGRLQTLPRPLARTTPVVLDHGRIAVTVPILRTDRTTGQAVLIILMALAFAAIVLAKVTGGGAPADGVSGSPTPQVSLAAGGPSSGATGAPTAVSSADPGGSASPSAATGSGAPGSAAPAGRTYRVKAGETLLGIANRFGISYKALAQLNGIVSPYNIKSGQVLKLP
ncbi:MAG: LysM domain [Chloroflexota bacterium]|jgi:hypothetical protein|nr:LysM domain [Chloroflexota bacterium]